MKLTVRGRFILAGTVLPGAMALTTGLEAAGAGARPGAARPATGATAS